MDEFGGKKKRMMLVSWEKVCMLKKEGKLGLRPIR